MPQGADPSKPRAKKATPAKKAAKATKKATPAKKATSAKKAATSTTKAPPPDPTIVLAVEPSLSAVDVGGPVDPRRSRARALLIGVVLGSIVAAIALVLLGGSDDDPSGASPTSTSSPSIAGVDDDSSADVAPSIPGASTSTTAKRSSKSATSSTATTTTVRVPTVVPSALVAPKAGRYPIKVVSSGSEATGTLVVGTDGWQRRQLGAGGAARTEQLAWTDAGARLVASGEPGEDGSCRWDGRVVSVPSDLRDGRTWSSRVTCESEVDDNEVKVVRLEEAKVTKRARTQLAGRSLDTWVIERRISVTIRAEDFTTTSVSISTELFAPELGIPVYSTSRTDVPLPDGGTNAVYASEEVLGLP